MFSMPSHYRQWREAQLCRLDKISNASSYQHEVIIYQIWVENILWFVVLMDDVRTNMQKCGFQQLNKWNSNKTESFFLCELPHGCWLKLACTRFDLVITQYCITAHKWQKRHKLKFLSNISRTVSPTTKRSSSSDSGHFFGPYQKSCLFPRCAWQAEIAKTWVFYSEMTA